MRKKFRLKIVFHGALIGLECVVLGVLVFCFLCRFLPFADRVYSVKPGKVAFKFSHEQDDLLSELNTIRVDYSTRENYTSKDIAEFTADHMVWIPVNKEDPYGEYTARLPIGVLKVRVNVFAKKGVRMSRFPDLESFVVNGSQVDVKKLQDYFNLKYLFYGKTYIPDVPLRGYLGEVAVLAACLELLVMFVSIVYFKKNT